MEIDLGLAAAVAISSAAGWYAGHFFERKKAIAAFARIRQQIAMATMQSTTGMLNGVLYMFDKLVPNMTKEQKDSVVNEYITFCNSQGLNLQIMTEEKAKQLGIPEAFLNANSDSKAE